MAPVRRQLRVVGDAGLGAVVVGVGPRFFVAGEHLPPYAYKLHGRDPRRVFDFARLVEVEHKLRGEDVAGVVADDEGAPRRVERKLEIGSHAEAVRHEVCAQLLPGGVGVEQHGRVAVEGRLVDVDVEGIGSLEQKRRLHAEAFDGLTLGVAPAIRSHSLGQTSECRFREKILVRVVVAGDAEERRIFVAEIKFGAFAAQGQVVCLVLTGKLVAEAKPVVKEPEAKRHLALGACAGSALKVDRKLAEVVANAGVFAPDGFPRAVNSGRVRTGDYKAFVEGHFVGKKAEAAFADDLAALVVKRVVGRAGAVHINLKSEISRGRCDDGGRSTD